MQRARSASCRPQHQGPTSHEVGMREGDGRGAASMVGYEEQNFTGTRRTALGK
jgi:hypothetical protein